jgi:putative membrane protein
MRLIARVLINGLALWVASWILPGLEISSSATADAVAKTGVTQGTDTIGLSSPICSLASSSAW